MCEECGCGKKSKALKIEINRSVTEENDRVAQETSAALKRNGVLCVNLMGAPGSGKTAVIEGLAKHILQSEIAVIEGDLESDVDKRRLEARGINSFQINTHSGCHLNAFMIKDALGKMDLFGKKYLIIENVGNLVCPAGVKIGQHINVLVSSTTEGSDKPKKYPIVFIDSSLIIISKADLSAHVGFDEKSYLEDIERMNPRAEIIKTSSRDKGSFQEIAGFLMHERDHLLHKKHRH